VLYPHLLNVAVIILQKMSVSSRCETFINELRITEMIPHYSTLYASRKSAFIVTLYYLMWIVVRVPCFGDIITVKLSLIREQNVIHKVGMMFW
jgi:hypothetical protein